MTYDVVYSDASPDAKKYLDILYNKRVKNIKKHL
jgi:hypothetical protein